MTAESEIRRRINKRGPITFAEFMGLALYWPDGGYYANASRDPGRIGSKGDYYTSPMVHAALGGLVSVQLFQMWQLLGEPSRFTVLEHGCGNLQLGRDILGYSTHLPGGFRTSLHYLGIERNIPTRPAGDDLPFPVVSPGAAPVGVTGCVLSNELLDAFPVHQVKVDGGELGEVYVTLEDGELIDRLGPVSTPALAQRLDGLGIRLAEGQVAEINLGLADWLRNVSASLESGYVLTIDYGREAKALYSAEQRMRGSLTTFYHHTQTDAPLRRVGYQDMTSQVDFTSLMEEGRQFSLETTGFTSQGWFLKNLGLEQWKRQLAAMRLPQRQAEANRAGMEDLARPGGLGDFRVLVQKKNAGSETLWGFQPGSGAPALLKGLPTPLSTSRHLDLVQARYPSDYANFENLWPGTGPD